MNGAVAADPLWPAPGLAPYLGPFRSNIQAFLRDHATPVPLPAGLRDTAAWVLQLRPASEGIRLHVYRERIDDADAAVCDACRIMGQFQRNPRFATLRLSNMLSAMTRVLSPLLWGHVCMTV